MRSCGGWVKKSGDTMTGDLNRDDIVVLTVEAVVHGALKALAGKRMYLGGDNALQMILGYSPAAPFPIPAISASFVLFPGSFTTAGAPAYVKGGIYFDTTLNKLRIGGAAGWETVTSS